MSRTIETLLLLALPASGKSELRRYLDHLEPAVAERDLHLGPVVQLDDYPYVHMMRRIDEELLRIDETPVFFVTPRDTMREPRNWGMLIHLLNEDYATLGKEMTPPGSAALWLFDRFDRAHDKVGAAPALGRLDGQTRSRLSVILEEEAADLREEVSEAVASWRPGCTVVIEFARGGPHGATMPLTPPHGYAYSLGELSETIKDRASILYVWVTPEESRRRNEARAKPGREGDASILFHGVPLPVMMKDYGVDDFLWLLDQSNGSIRTGEWELPAAIFDNRMDRTSFLRAEPDTWPKERVADLHATLAGALEKLRG